MAAKDLRHGACSGGRSTPEYRAYTDARNRCTNPKAKGYERYGGRGIKFLFINFEQWFADLGLRPEGTYPSGYAMYSVDRRNNEGHYEPGNVKWSTTSEQSNNRRLTQRHTEETKSRLREVAQQKKRAHGKFTAAA
jgi:hypothetical protein